MKFKKTIRGSGFYEFTDTCGVKCSLQKSSAATEEKIWLGVNDAERMHLNQRQVKALLPVLQLFVETGEIRPLKPCSKRV